MKPWIFIALAGMLAGCGGHKAVTRADYEREIRAQIPFAVDTFYRVSDGMYAFATRLEQHVAPDYRQKDDGTFIVQASVVGDGLLGLQPADEIWRNVIVSPRRGRVLCVDRIVKDGKYGGYVYVMQNDNTPHGTYTWDVTQPAHLQAVGHSLDDFLANTRELLQGKTDTLRAPRSQDDYWRLIFATDTMTNLTAMERVLDVAFTHDRYILPSHLTYYADMMAYGGHHLAADRYQQRRIALEPDYYDQDGSYGTEIASTFVNRRERYNYNLELKNALEAMFEADQHHRLQWALAPDGPEKEKLALRAQQTDSVNLARVKELLATHGYPRRSEVGEMAVTAVWLVVQHADLDSQRAMLPALEAAAQRGDLDRAYVAALHDRIDVRDGRPQRYGTQRDASGVLCPLLDPSRVDQWRQEVGLPPLEK